eukprot:8834518-Pyramimonas_sp.AAC.1
MSTSSATAVKRSAKALELRPNFWKTLSLYLPGENTADGVGAGVDRGLGRGLRLRPRSPSSQDIPERVLAGTASGGRSLSLPEGRDEHALGPLCRRAAAVAVMVATMTMI